MSNDNSNKKFKREVSDNDIDEVLKQDWLDEEDDQSKPEEGDAEPGGPITEGTTDSKGKEEQETTICGKFDIADLRLSELHYFIAE